MTKVTLKAKPNPQIMVKDLGPTDWFFTHDDWFCMYLEVHPEIKNTIRVLCYNDANGSLAFDFVGHEVLVTPVKNITISIT